MLGIHTFEMVKQVEIGNYYPISKAMEDYSRKNHCRFYRRPSNDNNKQCSLSTNKGVHITLTYISGNKDDFFYKNVTIRYRINPCIVLGKGYVEIFKSQDTNNFILSCNLLLLSISLELPSIDNMNPCRIDYCADIQLNYLDIVNAYIEISKRTIPCSTFAFFEPEVENYNPDFSTYFKNKTETIVLYDKYNGMVSIRKRFTDDEFAQAFGLLRLEVHLTESSLENRMCKYNINSVKEILENAEIVAYKVLRKRFVGLYGKGDYHSYKKAKEIIKSCKLKKKLKNSMLSILEYTSKCKGLEKGLKFLSKSQKLKYSPKYLFGKFDDLSLNPCTIPRRWKGAEEWMPGFVSLIEACWEKQKYEQNKQLTSQNTQHELQTPL